MNQAHEPWALRHSSCECSLPQLWTPECSREAVRGLERSPSWNEFYGDNFNFIVKTIKEYVEKEVDYDRCENTENVEEYDDEVAQNFNIDPYEYEKLIAEIFENLS